VAQQETEKPPHGSDIVDEVIVSVVPRLGDSASSPASSYPVGYLQQFGPDSLNTLLSK